MARVEDYASLEEFKTSRPDLPIDASMGFLRSLVAPSGIHVWNEATAILQYRQDTDADESLMTADNLPQFIGGYKLDKYISSFHEIGDRLPFLNALIRNSAKQNVEHRVINESLKSLIVGTGQVCKLIQRKLTTWGVRTTRDTSVFTGFEFEVPGVPDYQRECFRRATTCEPGQVISFPFCISTSANMNIATKRFTSSPEQIVLEIILPGGAPFPFISLEGIEAEVLLPFGCQLQYQGRKHEDNRRIFVFRLVDVMSEGEFNGKIDANIARILHLYTLRISERGAANGGRKTKKNKRKSKRRKTKVR